MFISKRKMFDENVIYNSVQSSLHCYLRSKVKFIFFVCGTKKTKYLKSAQIKLMLGPTQTRKGTKRLVKYRCQSYRTESCIETKFLGTVERLSTTFTANGKQQAAACHKSMKINVFQLVSLLRSYSICLGNRQEKSLNKSSFSLFW